MAVPNLWRTKKQRYRLQAEVCPTCAQVMFPPREICPHCHQPVQETKIGRPEPEFEFTMVLALPQVSAPLVGGDD